MRKRIFEIIEKSEGDRVSAIYDIVIITAIIVSLIPLAFKSENTAFFIIDKICCAVFMIDYLLRLLTADYKYQKHTAFSFIRYPFSFMALIDLISILPSLIPVNSGFKVLRVFRMFRAMRVLRVFKATRY
nr:ion transporter [Clostridiales bacterium]